MSETETEQQLAKLERQLEALATQQEQLLPFLKNADSPQWRMVYAIRDESAAIRQEIVERLRIKQLLLAQGRPAAADGTAQADSLHQKLDQLGLKLEHHQASMQQQLAPLTEIVVSLKLDTYLPRSESSASHGSARRNFRGGVLQAYQAERTRAGKEETWCVVTGVWWPKYANSDKNNTYVRGAHIFRRSGPPEDLRLLDMEGKVDDPDVNGLPMMTVIEWCFDRFQIILLPTVAESVECPRGEYKVYILDPRLMDVNLYDKWKGSACKSVADWTPPAADCSTAEGWPATSISFRQLHGRTMQFVEGVHSRPSKRVLTWHATLALLHAKRMHWEVPAGVPRSIGHDHPGWASPALRDKLERVVFWQTAAQAASPDMPEMAGAISYSYTESDAE